MCVLFFFIKFLYRSFVKKFKLPFGFGFSMRLCQCNVCCVVNLNLLSTRVCRGKMWKYTLGECKVHWTTNCTLKNVCTSVFRTIFFLSISLFCAISYSSSFHSVYVSLARARLFFCSCYAFSDTLFVIRENAFRVKKKQQYYVDQTEKENKNWRKTAKHKPFLLFFDSERMPKINCRIIVAFIWRPVALASNKNDNQRNQKSEE